MKKVSSNRQGIALVLVLGFLVLISGLVIAFFTSVSNDAVSARVTDSGSQSRQLTDTAVNIVMGQIRQATSRGNKVAWASQPGMIRTYAQKGTSGGSAGSDPLAYYKLYSASDMEISEGEMAAFDPAADLPTLASGTTNALYTDLNSPAKDTDGNLQYPIFDPLAVSTVKGFSLPGANPSSMPVRWQYVLRDGTVSASTDPIGSSGTSATWTSGPAEKYPTKDNPIVGRIAYWTDDETCKVNINTAAGDEDDPTGAKVGSYWDTPRYASVPEQKNYSDKMPAQNEFQRFPGHPATVYLSKIFPSLTRSEISSIAPRISEGGTRGGTVDTKASATKIDTDKDRLYSSSDELALSPSRALNAGLSTKQVEQAKFFLTAQSRAPEVNLSNKPRISMWPISSRDDSFLTPYDKVLRQCATINSKAYYFRRTDSQSTTEDAKLNQDLFNYLDNLTENAIPGFGGNFQSKYPTVRTQLLVEMLDYIRITNLHDTLLADPTKRYTSEAQKGQVVPLQMNSEMGFGRFFTMSEAGLIFSNEAEVIADPAKPATPATPKIVTHAKVDTVLSNQLTTSNKIGDKIIQAAWVMEPFCVAAGYTTINADTTWTVTGLQNLFVTNKLGQAVPLFDGTINYTQTISRFIGGNKDKNYKQIDLGTGVGAVGDFRNFLNPGVDPKYKFLGNQVLVDGDNFAFTGGAVTVTIKSASGDVVQTIELSFPSATGGKFPAPRFEQNLLPLIDRTAMLSPVPEPSSGSAENNALTLTNGDPNPAIRVWLSAWDTVRTVGIQSGDPRTVARQKKPGNLFVKSGSYDLIFSGSASASLGSQSQFRFAHAFQCGNHGVFYGHKTAKLTSFTNNSYYPIPKYPNFGTSTTPTSAVTTGDFDNGVSTDNDGAFINKPDEGVLSDNGNYRNYFSGYNAINSAGDSYFSPNKIIPSPGMFGSLLTSDRYRTLLFRNQPSHPSFSVAPKDYLLMDLFWMPIVQPYAISEPFSTAGKINLNYQIVPFTSITRTTALEAALAGEKYLALPTKASGGNGTAPNEIGYKTYGSANSASSKEYRKPVNIPYFLSKLQPVFDGKDIFRSASQICDYDLDNFDWVANVITGDNTRERPYTNIYQKLTTKSNTYMVHYRVQVLKQLAGTRSSATQWATWNEGKDQVLSENRGSSIIERYVDPNQKDDPATDKKDESLPNFLTNPTASIDDYYRFRIVSTKKFAP